MKETLFFFKDKLSNEDFDYFAKEIKSSVGTVKKYFNGHIPDTYYAPIIAEKLIELAKVVVEKNTKEIIDKLESL